MNSDLEVIWDGSHQGRNADLLVEDLRHEPHRAEPEASDFIQARAERVLNMLRISGPMTALSVSRRLGSIRTTPAYVVLDFLVRSGRARVSGKNNYHRRYEVAR